MKRVKCLKCGLVNTSFDEVCRRCGASLLGNEYSRPVGTTFTSLSIPIRPILFLVLAGVVAYWYFAEATYPNLTKTADPTHPKPEPTLSLRQEHEQKTKSAYFEAIKNGPGIRESQKHLEETKKLTDGGGSNANR